MPRRLLLIDDDRLQARIVAEQITDFHGEVFELDWADTYEEGLARLLSDQYAACLLDYQLGPRNGLELLQEAGSRGCRTPIIFLTAETSEVVDIEAMNAGAHDYLVKGEITPRTLERSLRYALRLSATLQALRTHATHDPLTGLLNRREFDRLLGDEVERARRFGHPLAIAIADIDLFKRVNDAFGHPAGDAALREVALRLQTQMRSVDRLLRYGGEEFAALLIEMDRAAALELARGMGAALEHSPVVLGGGLAIAITVSIGLAVFPEDAGTATALIDAADQALYAAKAGGRNRTMAFGGAGDIRESLPGLRKNETAAPPGPATNG